MPGIQLSRVLFSFQLCRGASCRFPRALGHLLAPCSCRIRRYPRERPPAPLGVLARLELAGRLWNIALGLGCGGKGGNSLWNVSVCVSVCRVTCAVPARGDVAGRVFPVVFPTGFPPPSLLGDGLELSEFVAEETRGGQGWGLKDRDSRVEVTLGPCVAHEGQPKIPELPRIAVPRMMKNRESC